MERYVTDRIVLVVKMISGLHSATHLKSILGVKDGDCTDELHKICILPSRLNEVIQKLVRAIDFHPEIRTRTAKWTMGTILNVLQAIERVDVDFGDGRCCLTWDQVWILLDHADQWYSITSEKDHFDLFERVIIRNASSFKAMVRFVVGMDNRDDTSIVRFHLITSIERCKKTHLDTVNPYGAVLAYINEILPDVKARVRFQIDANDSNSL
jgi:hypothetical protein